MALRSPHYHRLFCGSLISVWMLVREFIRKSLYAAGEGYFTKTNCVFSPPSPVRFNSLFGKWDYAAQLTTLYRSRPEAWYVRFSLYECMH